MINNSREIRLFKPAVGSKEIQAIKKTFKKSWLGYGPLVNKFEHKFSKFIGTKYAVAVNSCTAALHISLAVNKFKKGKKVLVPAITFSATAAAVLYCGLIPVFVDVEIDSLNMSFEDLKNKYTKDCVAVIPVHFGGHPCKMEKIIPWAKKRNLLVIEDCAETCGSFYKGKKLGTWGDYGCFSFEEKKIMTTGDGGMICTNQSRNIESLKSIRFHGWNRDSWQRHIQNTGKKNINKKHWDYEIVQLGFKYNMNDLTASIGLEQLKKIHLFNNQRSKIIKKYLSGIKDLRNIYPTFSYATKKSSYWIFSIRCKKRDKLIKFLKSKKIYTSVHLMPLPLHSFYKKYKSNIPNAIYVWKELVSLPFYSDLKNNEISYIIKALREFDDKFF